MLVLTKHDNTLVEVDLSNFAKLDANNIFTGDKNTFNDIFLGGPENPVAQQQFGVQGAANGNKKWGRRDFNTAANGKYVKSIQMAIASGVAVGTSINVSLWEVKKGADRTADTPIKIVDSTSLNVQGGATWTGSNGGLYVELPINNSYAEDTYFIYSIIDSTKAHRAGYLAENDNNIHIDNGLDVTQDTIGASSRNTVGIHRIIFGDVDIVDLIKNAGKVKKINNQDPDGNGNIVISGASNADTIKFAVNGVDYFTLDYMTTQQVDDIKALIDAI